MGRGERIVIGIGLSVAVAAGAGAGGFESVDIQVALFALSSLGWVMATGILALRHAARSQFVVAAGFLVLTIAETLLWVSGRSGDPGYETGFAGGAMFYVPGLMLVAAPGVYHWVVRAFAALGSVVWAAGSVGYLTGGSLAHTDPVAMVGYALVSVAFIGVAVAAFRRSPPFGDAAPAASIRSDLTRSASL